MRAVSFAVVLLCALPAIAEPRDYFMLFTTDSTPYKPTNAHTFAVLVRIDSAPGKPPRVLEVRSLSWLPATMKVRAFAIRPEMGRNLPLDETIQFYLASCSRICMWGPYLVCPEFAETFRSRTTTVESSFGYKAAAWLSPLHVCDCIRSVEEMTDSHRRYIGVFGYGAAGGSYVIRKFSPWFIEPDKSHRWIEPLIGLDRYPLVHREFGDYTSKGDQFRSWLRR